MSESNVADFEVMTEAESRRKSQKHRDECQECTFVASKEDIFYSSKQEAKCLIGLSCLIGIKIGLLDRESKIIELGLFTPLGSPNHTMFYLFQCIYCGKVNVNYISGCRRLPCINNDCGALIKVRGGQIF